ncbi:MAG TPA: phospholipid carrier-dependent glycosyltransferase [Chthoniobacterales bacterium]|jgi:hypothetical protein|nr:phospholipid carrier-dependent glycosyltransferase [Chthoniobacterales bacterium]
MNRAQLIRFAFALVLQIVFFATLNLFDDWTLESMPLKFVGAALLSGAAYLAAVSNFKIDISPPKQALLFWSVAVLLRIIALPLNPGDDLTRNEWEGKVQRAGFNPYLAPPSDPKLDYLRRDFPQASKINHPELSATDGPAAEVLFRFLSGITDRPLLYKILFAIADLGVAAVLLRLIGGEDRYRAAAWYAWNPLVAYAFAGAAHSDSLMLFAQTSAILVLARSTSEPESARQWLWAIIAAILLGIAISLNVAAAAVFPVFAFALRWRAVALAGSVIIALVFALPFRLPNIWSSLGHAAQLSRLNDLFWWIAESVWDNRHQRSFHYYPILAACVIAVSLMFARNWKRGMLWAVGTVILLLPVLHAWYVIWILPIATWRRAYVWHVLSITLFSYYLFWDERLFGLPWHAEPWLRALIIAPVLASFIMLAAQKKSAPVAT